MGMVQKQGNRFSYELKSKKGEEKLLKGKTKGNFWIKL